MSDYKTQAEAWANAQFIPWKTTTSSGASITFTQDTYAPPGIMYCYSSHYLKHPTMNYKITVISPSGMAFDAWDTTEPVKLKLDEEW